jgi:integrase
MKVFKRGNVYWFHFQWNGKHIQKSTKVGNAQKAQTIASAYRTKLAMGEVGIEEPKPKPEIPTFSSFKQTFMEWVKSELPSERTREFYETCYDKLCEFKELSKAKLSEIDEALIERYKLSEKDVSKTTVNRYLATLRKALRYAHRPRKLIDEIPEIKLYKRDKDNTVERECQYVYSKAEYQAWLAAAREPLRSASVLAYESGICRGEMLALQRDCVDLWQKPDEKGSWGKLTIRRGLKRLARQRTLPITEDMAAVLFELLKQSRCEHIFTSLHDHRQPLSVNTLADQHRVIMETCTFNPDAGLHALRHTFLTAAGQRTRNLKALQKLAGHSRITTTMRYVHEQDAEAEAIALDVQQARTKKVATFLATPDNQQPIEARKM